MAISSGTSTTPPGPLTGDPEANSPPAHRVPRKAFFWTWADVKREWKTGRRQMRHWITILVIMALAIGLAVYYTVGKHD